MVEAQTHYAIVQVRGDAVNGIVKFRQTVGQQVEIRAELTGLTKGRHGFHVHEFGNLTNGCASAGAHYNPTGVEHAGPEDEVRHVGDLGNIEVTEEGVATVHQVTDRLVNLHGAVNNVIGRSIVVHADEDDLGRGGQSDSKTTGHAGARVACGVIALSNAFEF